MPCLLIGAGTLLLLRPVPVFFPLFFWGVFRAMAYNFVHSQNVSEMCQFYTVNATRNASAICGPACLDEAATQFFQYPLRLPGATGGTPGSCAQAKRCPLGQDKLMCCNHDEIAYWNNTDRNNTDPRPANHTIANTCVANFDTVLNLNLFLMLNQLPLCRPARAV